MGREFPTIVAPRCGLRVADRSLRPLHALTRLRVLESAAYYPDEEFRSLRRRCHTCAVAGSMSSIGTGACAQLSKRR